jgi:hypothetical protein
MKSTRKTATKKTAKGKAEAFTSASNATEDIEEAAGETGRIAHLLFFTYREQPAFIRDAITNALGRAAAALSLPNPDETEDDRTAYQQLIDLVNAAGDDFKLPAQLTAALVAQGSELSHFAHHLAEAIRIARDNPILPARLYNGLANALNDFENDLPSLARVSESEPHILITLEAFIEQTAAQTAKGGAR